MGDFEIVGESTIHRGYTISLSKVFMRDPEGVLHERDVVRHPGAVSVVALDGDDVVMVRQYRVAVQRFLLEIPAGKLDVPGEDPMECAARELAEEIGMSTTNLEHLTSLYLSPGFADELHHIYLARDLAHLDAGSAPDGAEERHMAIVRVPLANVPDMIQSGELCDAKTIIGCTLALAMQCD